MIKSCCPKKLASTAFLLFVELSNDPIQTVKHFNKLWWSSVRDVSWSLYFVVFLSLVHGDSTCTLRIFSFWQRIWVFWAWIWQLTNTCKEACLGKGEHQMVNCLSNKVKQEIDVSRVRWRPLQMCSGTIGDVNIGRNVLTARCMTLLGRQSANTLPDT